MQHERAMRVQHALRSPRGSRRVAHHRGRLLIDLVEVGAILLPRQQLAEVERSVGQVIVIADHDDATVADARSHGLERGPEHLVDDDDRVVCVIDDVAELVGMQPDVQRVEDGARRGDTVVGLQVRHVIPAEGGHAITAADAERAQRGRQAAGVAEALAVGGPADAPVGAPADNRLVRKQRCRAPQERRNRQLRIHHQPTHGRSPPGRRSSPRAPAAAARHVRLTPTAAAAGLPAARAASVISVCRKADTSCCAHVNGIAPDCLHPRPGCGWRRQPWMCCPTEKKRLDATWCV